MPEDDQLAHDNEPLKYKQATIEDLIPYARNARIHTEAHIAQLAGSIREFGFNVPVLIDDEGNIIAGHGRVLAARKLGMLEVPVLVASHLTDIQRRAYIIADNKLHDNSAFDQELLQLDVDELKLDGFDLRLAGFEAFELGDLLINSDGLLGGGGLPPDEPGQSEGKEETRETPPPPKEAMTKSGDVWILGNHRLMCGDATSITSVDQLMAGRKADMVFTDPPYNIASDSTNYAADVSKSMQALKDSEWDKGFDVKDSIASIIAACSDNVTLYIWTSHFLIASLWEALAPWADYTSYLVWSKPNPMPSLSKRHPTWNTELCVYATKGGIKRTVNFPEGEHFLSCRNVVKKSDGSHPTQKPIELIEPLITFSSNRGQTVMDLFGGSGSTLIACEKTGRHAMLMEIDPKYCDVIIKRYENYTGNKAALETSPNIN